MLSHLLVASLILTSTAATPAPTVPTAPTAVNPPAAPATPQAKPTAAPAQAAKPAKNGATPAEVPVGRFSTTGLSGWTDKSYKGKTNYTVEDGVVKAHAVKAGSGKVKELSVDTSKYPILSWKWKIDHTLKREDIRLKSGDDFAARIYVIFPRTLFWKWRAINYVWAGKMPKNSEVRSPYTDKSMIIAVESGDEKAGKWVSEERNIHEDYKRIFGEEPPLLGGVAILTDTDDTQDEATAWYGDITLRAAP